MPSNLTNSRPRYWVLLCNECAKIYFKGAAWFTVSRKDGNSGDRCHNCIAPHVTGYWVEWELICPKCYSDIKPITLDSTWCWGTCGNCNQSNGACFTTVKSLRS